MGQRCLRFPGPVCGDADLLEGGCPGAEVCENWKGPRPTKPGTRIEAAEAKTEVLVEPLKPKKKAVQGSLFDFSEPTPEDL